jgi:hypothetical protein
MALKAKKVQQGTEAQIRALQGAVVELAGQGPKLTARVEAREALIPPAKKEKQAAPKNED